MREKLLNIFSVFKESGKLLAANDPLRMAGATAFFTTFALPPMLMIIVRALGLFFDKRIVGRQILDKVGNVLGNDGREQILSVIKAVRSFRLQPFATVLVFIFLLFVATTLFMVIKDSVNQLWRIRVNKKRHILSILLSRLKAIGFILFTGVLFLAVMAIELVQAYFGPYLSELSPRLGSYAHGLLNPVVALVVVSTWFFVLLRFLPDGRPKLRSSLAGALVAGVLFSVGKYILSWGLSGNIKEIYGGSGSLVLILLFVFYTALILYYGAAFTRVWAEHYNGGIIPLPHASGFQITKNDLPVQQEKLPESATYSQSI